MVILGPTVWEEVMGYAKGSAPFPSKYPAIISVTAAFLGIWIFSLLDSSEQAKQEHAAYEAQDVRCQTGIGAEGASGH